MKVFKNEFARLVSPFEKFGERDEFLRHPKLAPKFEEANEKYHQRIAAGRASAEKRRQDAAVRAVEVAA